MTAELQELLAAKKAANDAYYGHKKPDKITPEQEIEFDLEEKRLLRASNKAEDAYRTAITKIVDSEVKDA